MNITNNEPAIIIEPIYLGKDRVFRIQMDESASEEKIRNLIDNKEGYLVVEYNSLINKDEIKPAFLKLVKAILHTLDKNIGISKLKKFVQYSLLAILVLSVVIFILSTIFSFSENSLFKTLDKRIFYVIAAVIGIVIIIVFWIFELPDKLKILNSYLNPKRLMKFNKMIEEHSHEVSAYSKMMKTWLPRDKKLALVLYYLYWEVEDEETRNGIYKFISEIMANQPNISLIYCVDNNDLQFGPHMNEKRDNLKKELLKKELQVADIKIPNLYEEELRFTAKKLGDAGFYEKLLKELRQINPNEFEIGIILHNFDQIYQDYQSNNKEINLQQYITSEFSFPVRVRKNQVIASRFFANDNCFNLGADKNLEVLLVTLLYHYYFFNKPLAVKTLEKILALSHAVDVKQFKLNAPEFLHYLLYDDNPALTSFIHKEYIDTIKEKVSRLKSVDLHENAQAFSLRKELWLVNYIIINRDGLYQELHRLKYLETDHLVLFNEYVKLFLFLDARICMYSENEREKLLSYVSDEDKPLYYLFLSQSFSEISFEKNKAPENYIYGSKLSERFWLKFHEYKPGSYSIPFSRIKVSLSDLKINPYVSFYQLLSDALHKAEYVDSSFETLSSIAESITDNPFPGFDNEFEVFKEQHSELVAKYNFYTSEYNYDRPDNYPYINLMIDVDDKLVILLPVVTKDNSTQVPVVEIDKYLSAPTTDPDFIFLQILALIHNNYLYIDNTIEKRKEFDEKNLILLLEKARDFENLLFVLQKKELNFRDYCMYTLHEAKYYLVFNLLNICKIEHELKMYKHGELYNPDKFKIVVERFEMLGYYFGVVDALFWECWFETRLAGKETTYFSGDNYILNKPKVEQNLRKIIRYKEEYLKYVHFDCGLIYMGIITDSIIEPPKAYTLIKNFLRVKTEIPKFIKYQLVSSLYLICYNGQFKNPELLNFECIQLHGQMFSEFSEYINEQDKLHYLITVTPKMMSDLKSYEKELEKTFAEIHQNLDMTDAFNKGMFYFYYTSFLYHKENYQELIDSPYIDECMKLLKNHKFYYVQFLRRYVSDYYPLIMEKKINSLAEMRSEKIKEHNQLFEEYKNVKEDKAIGFYDINVGNPQKERMNILNKEIEDLNRQISNLRNVAALKELETEFEAFLKFNNISILTEGENQPHSYLIARTAHDIAKLYHARYDIRNEDALRYYEIALENYYQLEEYNAFLSIALELKPLYKNRHYAEKINRIEHRIKSILREEYSGPNGVFYKNYDENAGEKVERFAQLIYDYFNPALEGSREDYTYLRGLGQKIEKNTQGYRSDNDTRGLRKFITIFFTDLYNEANAIKLCKSFDDAASFALSNIQNVSLDDVHTFERALIELNKKLTDQIDLVDKKIDLEKKVKEIRKEYQNKAAIYLKEFQS